MLASAGTASTAGGPIFSSASAHVGDLELLVVRPFRRDAVELELGVVEGDVGIEARSGRGHQIAGDVVQLHVGMVGAPDVERKSTECRNPS